MNFNPTYITSKILKSQLDSFEESLIIKQKTANQAIFKQLVRTETTKLLQNLPRGVDKNQLLTLLQDIFGSKNFQNGKYKGGKEVVIETFYEFFGKENFKDGKFTGGWNEKQDTTNIHKVFGEKNFTNGEYTGGWNKTQDAQNLKQSLTDGEAKTLTSEIIEQKLGGSEKFQDGIYNLETEINNVVTKGFQNKGPYLRILRNIQGEKDYFPEEPSKDIPPGREGMRIDPEAIARNQLEQQARIDAIAKWKEFHEDHGITEPQNKSFWENKYGSSIKTAEGVYKDAILKAAEIVGEDKPLNDLEKNRINKAPTPAKIEEILTDIPKQRRAKEWNNFFEKHDILNNIDPSWQDNWRKSNLSIEVAKLIYNNGWYNSPAGLIGDNKKIETYTTKTTIKGKDYEKTIQKIDPLKHLAPEVKKAHDFIVQRIDLETILDNFPTDKEISKDIYDEKQVPDTINYEELRALRDKKIVELFKQYFQGSNPAQLKDDEIGLWRTSPTGLPNTGKDQRQAFDNGWTNPKEITDSKINYQGITGIEVLKVKKADIDQEIQKVNNLVQKISNFKYLRELDAIQNDIDQQFAELKRELLPPNKDQQITDIVAKQRKDLYYSLTDPKDGGIEKSKLDEIIGKMGGNTWDAKNYDQVNTKIINAFLKADLGIKEMNESLDAQIKNQKDPAKIKILEAQKLLQPGRGYEDLDRPNEQLYGTNEEGEPNSYLMSQGGYTLPDDVVEFEERLPVEKRGSSLLEFFYDKSRDGKNRAFDPHKYVNDPEASKTFFCLPGKKTITWTVMERQGMSFTKVPVTKTKEIEVVGGNEGTQGHLAMAAGVGKTTKTINCIVNGGKEHVVLVAPLLTLVESAVKHHTSWLPDWGCVFHKKSKTIKVLKGSLKPATEEEISSGLAEDAEVFASHGDYPVKKNELVYWVDDKGTAGGERLSEGKKGLSVLYYGILAGYCAREKLIKSGAIDEWQPDNTSEWNAEVLEKIRSDIKSKLLPKDTIFAFDEAHYNIGAYQALQLKMVQAGYKVIRMSATFPGVPFSTTSTYPKKSYYSGELDPKMPGGTMKIANEKHAEALAKHRGVKPETIKWQDEKGQFLPVEVSLDERFRFGKTLIFVRDINITPEQDAVFGKKYSCVAFTPAYKPICETVSFGRQPGAVMLGNFEHQMGLTFEIDTVISTGLIEVSNLGKNFTFSDKTTQFEPISSLIQEQGRGGRIQWGLWITLTKEVQEIVVEEDVEAAMIKALFDGDITPIKDAEYPFFDIKMLWGGLAHPHRFGKPPSEALIGLKVDKNEKDRVKNKQPLTKIVWRTEADKGDLIQKGFFSSVIPDEALWERYVDDTPKVKNPETGKWEIIKMREDDSKELLKELIANFIAKDRNYPKGLNLRNQSNLIGAVYGDILKKGESEKDQVAKEVKNVLNGAIEKEIKKFIKDKVYDSNLQRSKDPKVIKDIVDLYQLNNSQVYFTFEENEEKKKVWTLNMKHNVIRT